MPTVKARDRLRVALQQVYLMTGGHTDKSLCHVLLSEDYQSSADMCQNTATTRVCVDNYRVGMEADGVFYPAETMTRVCDEHAEKVRQAPGFRWSAPLRKVGER